MNQLCRLANRAFVMTVLGTIVMAACAPLPAPTSPLAPPPTTTAALQPQPGELTAPSSREVEPTAPSSPAAELAASPLEGTLWGLVSYADQDGQPVDVLAGSEPTAWFQDGRVDGTASCNTYFGDYVVDGEQLTVKVGGTTMMACAEPIQAQESAYLANLGAAATFVIIADQLQIADAAGNTVLTYVAVQPALLTGTLWRLTAYNNGKGAVTSILAGTQITATLSEDGILAGSAGCNDYTAGYTTDGDAITIEVPVTTRMFCAEPAGVMDQESAYLAALLTAATYRVDGDRLEFRATDGALVADYIAAPEGERLPVTAEAAVPEIVGVVWRWVAIVYSDDTRVTPDSPDNYTLQLMPGREVRALADCNVASGTYTLDGDQLSMEIAATTRMACPPGSVSGQYLNDLNAAQSYVMDGKDLMVVLQNDSGSMRFEPAQPATAVEPTATPALQATEQPTSQPGVTEDEQILNVIWQWEVLNPPTGQPTAVGDPTRYEFMLLRDGKMRVKADCNTGSGTYQIDGSSISIVVAVLTRMACPPESLSDQFVQYLNQAATYRVEGKRLFLDLNADAGTMEFSQSG